MKALAAVMAAVCVCGASIHADDPETFTASVHLLIDQSLASRLNPGELEYEAENVWSPYGVRLAWVAAPGPGEAAPAYPLEAMIERRLKGPIMPDWAAVVGRAHVGPHSPSTLTIRISFDATEHMLSQRTGTGMSSLPIVLERDLARALGRVLAHEIGHVLLAKTSHDDNGLMRAVFTPDDLARPDRTPFRLTCANLAQLHRRVRALRAGNADR